MSAPARGGPTEADEFERHARAVLEDSVTRIDGRIRSRLNQARHAAVAGPRSFWRRVAFMPAASAVAATVLVAFLLWPHSHPGDSLIAEGGGRASVEDIDLLADSEALDLVSDQEADGGGAFYEWAVDQLDSNETSSTGA